MSWQDHDDLSLLKELEAKHLKQLSECARRIEALEEALLPFARYARQMKDRWGHVDGCVRYGVKATGAHQVTYGDFRQAARIMEGRT